ncbi:Pyrokinin-1 receptor [Sergentomyia squamirostris]
MDESSLHLFWSGGIISDNVTRPMIRNQSGDVSDVGAFDGNDTDYVAQFNLTAVFGEKRDPLYIVIPITIIYLLIFVSGLIGNISTCIVISRNKSMHTATNYYLFSLAISDFLLLITGVPQEMYTIWCKYPYVFGEAFCVLRGLAAETSANATILTITAFTVERYVAICHPFLSHTMSKLSRAVRIIVIIWIFSLILAIPQALQFGILNHMGIDQCGFKRIIIQHSFELSTFLFFFTPMTLITVLYVLIGLKLRTSSMMKRDGGTLWNRRAHLNSCRQQTNLGTRRVLKMLVAVVVAFFICWAPFHAQRLVAIYGTSPEQSLDPFMLKIYVIMTYISGVLYYLSTCINPLLYNIMSNKFREAFKESLAKCCHLRRQRNHTKRAYRILSRNQRRRFGAQESSEYSGTSIRDESVYSSSTQKQSFDSVTMSRGYSVNSQKNGMMGMMDDAESDTYITPIGMDILKESKTEEFEAYRNTKKAIQPLNVHNCHQKSVINFYPRMKTVNGQCHHVHLSSHEQRLCERETNLEDDDLDRDELLFSTPTNTPTTWQSNGRTCHCKISPTTSDLSTPSTCSHIYYFYHKNSNDIYDVAQSDSDWKNKNRTGRQIDTTTNYTLTTDNTELQKSDETSAVTKVEVQSLETELDSYMKQLKLREKR